MGGFISGIGGAVGSLFGGGGGGGGSNTVVQSTELPDYLEGPIRENINIAEGIANRPYQAYGAPTVAALASPQQQAINLAQSGVGTGQPQLAAAQQAVQNAITGFGNLGFGGPGNISAMTLTPQQVAAQNIAAGNVGAQNIGAQNVGATTIGAQNVGATNIAAQNIAARNAQAAGFNAAQMRGPADVQAQNFLSGDVGAYMNPFTQNVVSNAMRDLLSAGELGLQQVGQQARQAGAFGGSRQGVAEALQRSQTAESAGRVSAELRSQAFQDAASRLAADQARALQADLANQQMGFNVGARNQDATMRALSESAAFRQQANLANQDAALRASLANQQAGLTAGQSNQEAALRAALANQQAGITTGQSNQQAAMQAALANQQAGLTASQANQDAAMRAALANQQAGLTTSQANQDAAMRAALANQQAGLTAGQLNQASALQAAQANQQMGFDVARANQQARLAGLQGQLSGAQQLGQLGALGRDLQSTGISELLSTGAVQQAQNQAILDDAYARFLEQRNYPIDMLNLRIGATSSVPVAGRTTQSGGGSGGSSFLSTLGGIGSAAAGLAQLGSLFAGSDENMKTDVQKVGKDKETGLDLYAYRYKGDPKSYPKVVGPMAQDVEKEYPDQVANMGKYKAVNLGFGPMQRAFS